MAQPLGPKSENPRDFLATDSLLAEDEILLRDTVRRYVDEQILDEVGDWFDQGEFPHAEVAKACGDLGLLGMHLEGYGCSGSSALMYGLACMELEAGDSGLRSFVSVQGSLAMFPIWAYGSEEHKQEWLPRMAAGEAIGCFGLTEPDSGSDPSSMRTNAKQEPGGDWMNGRKMWITNGTGCAVAIVWAQTDDGIQGFVVPGDAKGFSAPEQKHKWSLRASITSELVLEDVRVPDSARFPDVRGLKGPLGCLTQARYGIAWGGVGAAMACFDEALQYSKERIVFDKPLAGFQIPQQKLANMATDITMAQMLALRLGRLKDKGEMAHSQVSMAKRNNVHMALKTARICRDMLGANGVSLEYQAGRHACNLESVITYEGTHDIHTLAIGHELTGLPAYR